MSSILVLKNSSFEEDKKVKKKNMNYIKFALDIIMAVTFVLFFNSRVLGGLSFHEIAGLAVAVIFFTHILLNWRWVKNVTVRLFDRKLPHKTRLGYFLNILLLIRMAFIIISGIFISRIVFPNINIGNEQWFKVTHISVSFLVLILVAVHVGLHWKWVVNVFKNIFKVKMQRPFFKILINGATIALLVFGIYEMYTTNFIMHVQGATTLFNPSSQLQEGQGHPERPTFLDEDSEEGRKFQRPDYSDGAGGQFIGGDHQRGKFRGEEDEFGASNALGVIGTYFGIMSVIIILTYYIEKFLTRRKRSIQI